MMYKPDDVKQEAARMDRKASKLLYIKLIENILNGPE